MDLLNYLRKEPRARERKNKNRAIGNVILNKYSSMFLHDCCGVDDVDKGEFADMVGEILSLDRKWRKILEENPDLRGSDYKEKDLLEEQALERLGYHQTP